LLLFKRSCYSHLVENLVYLLSLLLTSALLCSCSSSDSKNSRITFHAKGKERVFIFSVKDIDFNKKRLSKISSNTGELSEVNLELLKKKLLENSYCTDGKVLPSFELLSQQKVSYDKTFYSSIMQVHHLHKSNIISYFGRCLEKK
jgi:hypothetical protein